MAFNPDFLNVHLSFPLPSEIEPCDSDFAAFDLSMACDSGLDCNQFSDDLLTLVDGNSQLSLSAPSSPLSSHGDLVVPGSPHCLPTTVVEAAVEAVICPKVQSQTRHRREPKVNKTGKSWKFPELARPALTFAPEEAVPTLFDDILVENRSAAESSHTYFKYENQKWATVKDQHNTKSELRINPIVNGQRLTPNNCQLRVVRIQMDGKGNEVKRDYSKQAIGVGFPGQAPSDSFWLRASDVSYSSQDWSRVPLKCSRFIFQAITPAGIIAQSKPFTINNCKLNKGVRGGKKGAKKPLKRLNPQGPRPVL